MNKTELPLPAPHCNAHEDAGSYCPDMFSAFQMREYAADAVAAERERFANACSAYAVRLRAMPATKMPTPVEVANDLRDLAHGSRA